MSLDHASHGFPPNPYNPHAWIIGEPKIEQQGFDNDPGAPRFIVTVRGFGYKLVMQAE